MAVVALLAAAGFVALGFGFDAVVLAGCVFPLPVVAFAEAGFLF